MNSIVTMGMFGGNGSGGGEIIVEKIVYVDRVVNTNSGGGGHVVLGGGSHTIKLPTIKLKKINDEERSIKLSIKTVEEI